MAKQPSARKRSAAESSTAKPRRRSSAKAKSAAGSKKSRAKPRVAAAKNERDNYQRAIGLYEQALEALQRRDFSAARGRFQQLIDDFPDERELHERSRLYLQVCDRQSQPPPTPQSVEERIYAATLALNAGAPEDALGHLSEALSKEPDSDEVQYMLAVAQAAKGDRESAVTSLRRAIDLNPDNRFLARHEPIFDALREDEAFREAVTARRSSGGQARRSPQ